MKRNICLVGSVLVAAVLLLGNSAFAGGNPRPSGFIAFYGNFKQAVKSDNRKVIAELMADKFQWANDTPKVSKEDAITNMDSFKLWPAFKRAVNSKLDEFTDSEYPDGCFAVWDKKKNVGFIFHKEGGKWKWVGMRGD